MEKPKSLRDSSFEVVYKKLVAELDSIFQKVIIYLNSQLSVKEFHIVVGSHVSHLLLGFPLTYRSLQ
jgi:hypothetical protein